MAPLDDVVFSMSPNLYLLSEINFPFFFLPLLTFI